MQLIYGTANEAKYEVMLKLTKGLEIDIISLSDIADHISEAEELGNDPLANAVEKAKHYYEHIKKPVFSCDSGLYFKGVDDKDQPGVKIRRVSGKRLDDEEMIVHYSTLAKKYGGRLEAYYKNAICVVIDEENIIAYDGEELNSNLFIISEEVHLHFKEGFPLDSLSIHKESNQYYYDLEGSKYDQEGEYNGFYHFFKGLVSDYSHKIKAIEPKRFMIGHFNRFDSLKQRRDYRSSFLGIEVCQMETEEELNNLKRVVQDQGLQVGIHLPILKGQWSSRDPQVLSLDKEIADESYAYLRNQAIKSMVLNPLYCLIHFPKPVLLRDAVDWSPWRFGDASEYCFESSYPIAEFEEKTRAFVQHFSALGYEFGFTPLLELDALNSYIIDSTLLEELLDTYTNLKICLDFGRLHLQSCVDDTFDSHKIISKFGKYTFLVHLWNCTKENTNHYPSLKTLNRLDGWADMATYFRVLKAHNNSFKVLFEHDSSVIDDAELEGCYQWVEELIQ